MSGTLTSETIKKPQKERYTPIKNPTSRHVAVQTLLEHSNLPLAAIAENTGYTTTYVKELKHKLSKTSIITPKLLRLAKKRLTNILNLEPNKQEKVIGSGDVIEYKDYPSHSNVLEAINTVVNRSEPVTQKLDVTNTFDLSDRLVRAMERKRKALNQETDNI